MRVGILDGGAWERPEGGAPQGSILSPLLGNIYLHHVLDRWFESEVRSRLRGRALLVRYADDFAIAFEEPQDAERVMAVLPKRMQRFGLTLHPEKTRLVPFRRPPRTRKRGQGPGTFDFLGFTLYWRRTRGGRWQLAFKTRRARLERAIQRVHDFCRRHRHRPVPEQHKGLMRRLRGALQLLRGERQHPQLADAGERRGACLVQMAESPQPAIAPHQEAISGPPHGLPDTATSDRGPGVGHVALRDMVAEEPDGGNLLVRIWRGAGRVTGRPALPSR